MTFYIFQSSQVPAWMFLGWTSQIISELKYDRECFVDELLLRIAQTYPAAIIYPFTLSHSQYKYNCWEPVADRPLIKRINDIIHNPLIDRFVKGLTAVCVPFKMLYYHLTTLLNDFRQLSENQFEKKVNSIIEAVFPTDRGHHGTEFDKLKVFYEPLRNLRSLSSKY